MLPTFEPTGEIAIESIISHRLAPQSLARGELISLKSPINPNRIICKRVIGLPGDTICVDPTGLKASTTEHVFIPKGHIWIAGDNTSCSTDSRDYGPVSAALIRGRIVARVRCFPLTIPEVESICLAGVSIQQIQDLHSRCDIHRRALIAR
jgi:inner membrane protease subunit 1